MDFQLSGKTALVLRAPTGGADGIGEFAVCVVQ